MHIGQLELKALAGKRAISPALRRMADRENAKHAAQPSVPRPRIHPQDEDAFYREDKKRLEDLHNKPCPLCYKPLKFNGISLACSNSHGWSNPKVAEEEIALAAGNRFMDYIESSRHEDRK